MNYTAEGIKVASCETPDGSVVERNHLVFPDFIINQHVSVEEVKN